MSTFDEAYRAHARDVWGLCYRMTGSASDADDLVQETFERAVARPPVDEQASWRPWLSTVAVNLAKDTLRRRRHAAYTGPWLPSPVESDAVAPDEDQERRYGLLESASYAFLVAAEALTPQQRAVLLLRDVFDYSVRETAAALSLSDANVKTTLHRARASMSAYDQRRAVPTAGLKERTGAALTQFAMALSQGDVSMVEAVLAESVRLVNDGGGAYKAALKPILGARRVARFYHGLLGIYGTPARVDLRMVNDLPALVMEYDGLPSGIATRQLLRCDVDDDGRIVALYSVLAPDKLRALKAGADVSHVSR